MPKIVRDDFWITNAHERNCPEGPSEQAVLLALLQCCALPAFICAAQGTRRRAVRYGRQAGRGTTPWGAGPLGRARGPGGVQGLQAPRL